MRRTTRSDTVVELGQWLARELLETPVKEAVREALAEERATDGAPTDRGADDESDGTGPGPVAGVIAGLAAVGAVAYLLRRRGDDGGSPTRPSDVDGTTTAGERVEAETPVESEG